MGENAQMGAMPQAFERLEGRSNYKNYGIRWLGAINALKKYMNN